MVVEPHTPGKPGPKRPAKWLTDAERVWVRREIEGNNREKTVEVQDEYRREWRIERRRDLLNKLERGDLTLPTNQDFPWPHNYPEWKKDFLRAGLAPPTFKPKGDYRGMLRREHGYYPPIRDAPDRKATWRQKKTAKSVAAEQGKAGVLTSPDDATPPPTGFDSRDMTVDKNGKRVQFKHPFFGITPPSDEEWIEYYLKDTFLKGGKLYDIQVAMSRFMDAQPWAKFETWRGAGKSMGGLGKLVRRMCDDPNLAFAIISSIQAVSEARVEVVRKEIVVNPLILRDYGYLAGDVTAGRRRYKGKWRSAYLTLQRTVNRIEPSLMSIAWQDALSVGFHFDGVLFDDPWTDKNERSTTDFAKFEAWWGEFVGTLENVQFVWVLCTRKGPSDIYHWWDEKKVFSTFTKRRLVLQFPQDYEFVENEFGRRESVVIHDYDPSVKYVEDTCHGKFEIHKVLLIRDRQGHAYFEREYQGNPIPAEGILFKWADIRWFSPQSTDFYGQAPYTDTFKANVFGKSKGVLMFDPALGESAGSSYQVILAIGWYLNRYYLLDIWMGHWGAKARRQAFVEAHQAYPTFPIYVEEDFRQLKTMQDLTETLTWLRFKPFRSRGKGLKYASLFQGHGTQAAKLAKIYDGLEGVLSGNRVYVNLLLLTTKPKEMQEFQDEVKGFPDKCRYLDVIDDLAMAILQLDESATGPLIVAGKKGGGQGNDGAGNWLGRTTRKGSRKGW